MRKLTNLLLAVLLLTVVLFVLPVHGEVGIYDNVIRLHVLANSDSEADQALKLKVRDAILSETEGLFEGATSREQAAERLTAVLPQIKQIAEETLAAEGAPAPVTVTLGYEEYPRRSYEALALPAGEYLSLRVQIGAAAGQNWWCVMFPPLCMSAATKERETTCLAAGLTDEQYRLITDSEGTQYRVRFKLVEVAEQLFG